MSQELDTTDPGSLRPFVMRQQEEEKFASLRRRVRLLILLDAAESAGLIPIRVGQLHIFAYLTNVLAPVWEMMVLDGKVLKRRGGPFYPAMQHDLDGIVAAGLVTVSNLGYAQDEDSRWRLAGSYRLNHALADKIISRYREYEPEGHVATFILELAYALSALSEDEMASAVTEDATYGDELVAFGNVIDFADYQTLNYSANAANYFEKLIPGDASLTRGEKLHLYVQHLRQRMHDK